METIAENHHVSHRVRTIAPFALALAVTAALRVARADTVITGYQFTNDTFNPTTTAANLVASPFGYVNANPGLPPYTNPPFIVSGGILPDDPPFFVGQADWFPAGGGFNENYYTFQVSVTPGYALNINSLSFLANSRQQVPFLTQVQYATNANFANAVSFNTNPIAISTNQSWSTYTASANPVSQGTGTYYFRIYSELDPAGNGSISDLLNMSNVFLNGAVVSANNTNMYWDPGHTGAPGSGGSGTWLTSNAWASGAIDYGWNSFIVETANFAGPSGGNVSLGGNVIASGGLAFTTPGYTISAAANQTLAIAGTLSVAADATISAPLINALPGTLYKTGGGTLNIAGLANFSNTSLSINAGTLSIVSGGTLYALGASQYIAQFAGSTGTLSLSGNATYASDSPLILADQGGMGTLNIQDLVGLAASTLIVGNGNGAPGAGIVNQNGGSIGASVALAVNAGSSGTYHFNGGALATGSISGGAGNSTFFFNGGYLQLTADNPALFAGITNLLVQSNGALIDTNNHNITLAQSLAPDTASTGGLTKFGLGTLTIPHANSFTGPVNINAGILVAAAPNGTFSSPINVNPDATLQLGNAANQTNVLGNATNTPTLTVNGGTVTTFPGTTHNLDTVHLTNAIITGSATPLAGFPDYTLNSTLFADGDNTLSTINALGGIALNGNVVFNTVSSTAQLNIGANITNGPTTGALTKAGNGTLILSGNIGYSGNTTVSAGRLKFLGTNLPAANISLAAGATLEYDLAVRTFQSAATLTGNGTLTSVATAPGGQLVFGGAGIVNVNLSPGGLIDIESGTLYGSSSYGGNWTTNQGSLNIAAGAAVDFVEAGTTSTAHIDALTGAGNLSGGYFGNTNGLSFLTVGIANGSGNFSGNIADDPNAKFALIKAGTGNQTLSGNNTYTGGTTVNAGNLILATSTALAANSSLAIVANATVTESAATPITLKLGSLAIAGTTGNWLADLNLTNSSLILEAPTNHATVLATLQDQVSFGLTHSNGITSSTLPAKFTLAILDNAINHLTTYGGQSLDANAILITPVIPGDANLDGRVDLTDLAIVLNHFNVTSSAWINGNFDNALTIDATDLNDVLTNFGLTNTAAPSSEISNLKSISTPAPEPATLVLLLPALLLRKRRPLRYAAPAAAAHSDL